MLITGPSGCGKTTCLLEKYLELHPKKLTNNGYFLVPTQEHARRLLDQALEKTPVLFQPNIITFDEFVRSKAGITPLMETEKQLILREICLNDESKYFSEVAHFGVFYEKLSSLISELKQALIKPTDLAKIAKDQKLKTLCTIYEKYTERLIERKRLDLEDVYQKVSEEISALDFLIIDGFNDFTPLQEKILLKVSLPHEDGEAPAKAGDGGKLFVGLLSDTQRPLLFQNIHKTKSFFMEKLGLKEQMLAKNLRAKSPDLAFVQENFLKQRPSAGAELFEQKVQNIQLFLAADRIQEVELMAREIIRLTRQGAHWSDCAIIFRQIGGYQELIREVFRRYDIPVVIHEGTYLHKIRFIDWLLKLWQITPETIEEFCSSGFASPGLDQELVLTAAEELKNAADGTAVFKILDKFVKQSKCLVDLETSAGDPILLATVRESALAYDRLETVLERIPAPIPGTTLEQLIRDAITQELVKLRDEPGNQVQVYDALVARQKDYRFVFLGNLNMQSFPVRPAENIFVGETERAELSKKGFRLRRLSEKIFQEDFLFYQALCRAQEKLYLARPCAEIAGQKLSASWYLSEVAKLLPNIPEQKRTYADLIPETDQALSLNEYRRALLSGIFQNYSPSEAPKELTFLNDILLRWREPQELRKFGVASEQGLKEIKKMNVTALINYAKCGFPYFVESVLKIVPHTEDTLFQQRGNFIHAVLDKVLHPGCGEKTEGERRLPREKPNGGHGGPNGGDGAPPLNTFFEPETFAGYFPELHPRQLKLEATRLEGIIKRFCEKELSILQNDRTVAQAEITLTAKISDWELLGRVDRLDMQQGQAIIVDYKTGKLPDVSLKDLDKGLLTQVLVYALLYQIQNEQTPRTVEYKQTQTLEHRELDLIKEAAALPTAKKLVEKYLAAIRQGDFYTVRGKCDRCDYSLACGIKLKRGGT